MSQESFSRKPRFYYGRVERQIPGKIGYQLCLVDLKFGLFVWFENARELSSAVEALVSRVEADAEDLNIFQLPRKLITSEIPGDNFDDLFNEADELAETGEEGLEFDLMGEMTVRKDHLRNFRKVELDQLFAEKLELDRIFFDKEEETEKMSAGEEILRKMQGETVCAMRDFQEVEPADGWYGPIFQEADFTNDINDIPENIRYIYKFLDVGDLVAQAKTAVDDFEMVKLEVASIFHPELAEVMRKKNGLVGVVDPGPLSE